MAERAVILANGDFPVHDIPLRILIEARHLICCDGSAGNLISAGIIPEAIVGDLDSIEKTIAARYPDRIFSDGDQETNDLTKTVKWCLRNGYRDLTILGGTGGREDHTVGNISLLAEYARDANVEMVTNTGIFTAYLKSCFVPSHKGQQVSVFCIDPENEISSSG
ncbi:MAG: thiamine diphosphokinase, partial [Bacteroidales bacterium]